MEILAYENSVARNDINIIQVIDIGHMVPKIIWSEQRNPD